MSFSNTETIPAKTRGRKSKQYLLAQLNNAVEQSSTATSAVKTTRTKNPRNESTDADQPKMPRRGRKTKPTKLISSTQQPPPFTPESAPHPMRNVILFLRCTRKDLEGGMINSCTLSNVSDSHEPTSLLNSSHVQIELHDPIQVQSDSTCMTPTTVPELTRASEQDISKMQSQSLDDVHVERKISQMKCDMYGNNVHKSCACFWDSHEFDTPPVYIPKYIMDDVYHVYGCFCSPECAAAYLMSETCVDSSEKFERYQMLNYLYSTPNIAIKLAPDPRYMLHHFYGRLSIDEYRNLSKKDKLYTIVDKPMTRLMPEIYEENARFIFSSKTVL